MEIEAIYYESADGVKYKFSDEYKSYLLGSEGEGMPPINYISQTGTNQHGSTVVDYRLQPRTIQMVHRKNSCDRQGYWEMRKAILDGLRPNRNITTCPGKLVYRLPGGIVRCIDVFPSEGPTFSARNLENYDEFNITSTLRFLAPDPTFYDPTQTIRNVTLSPASSLVFPITFPITFSSAGIFETFDVTYEGSWASFPEITITGPMTGFIIYHEQLDKSIQLLRSIAADETVTISLPFGNKQVNSSLYGSIISSVSSSSSLIDFRLLTDGEVTDGINTLSIACSNVDGNTSVKFAYYTRYIGI